MLAKALFGFFRILVVVAGTTKNVIWIFLAIVFSSCIQTVQKNYSQGKEHDRLILLVRLITSYFAKESIQPLLVSRRYFGYF